MRVLTLAFVISAATCAAALINEVREAIDAKDFAKGSSLIEAHRKARGENPEMIAAMSWMARGQLKQKNYDKADEFARQTYDLAQKQLKRQKGNLDEEGHLPIALGAAIEVRGQVLAAQGQRDQAVQYLEQELKTYRNTSIRTRIQKNINLLSLEGKPAPALGISKYLGPKPQPLSALKGKPVVLFFWAHWCGDCKYQGPVLAEVRKSYKDLIVIGPTQHYGYVAGGNDADEKTETSYIDQVRNRSYSALLDMPVPLDEETFRNYGSSTTPTVVLIDRAGIVRVYHPGIMRDAELRAALDKFAK